MMEKLMAIKAWISRYVLRHPWRVTIYCGLFIIIFITVEFTSWKDTRFTNSTTVNVLAVVGIIGTLIGVHCTYYQLKIIEDRIDSYERLYEVLPELFRDKKAKTFQFFGLTLIPGHIAFDNADAFKEYQKCLDEVRLRLLRDFTLIVPSPEAYIEAYQPYSARHVLLGRRTLEVTLQYLQAKLDEVIAVQKELKPRCNVVEVFERQHLGLIDAYYFSNGRRVVYAVPLHYAPEKATEAVSGMVHPSETVEPALVGFVTTDRFIIKAFDHNFRKVVANIQTKSS